MRKSVKMDFSATKSGLNLFCVVNLTQHTRFTCSEVQRLDGRASALNSTLTHIYNAVTRLQVVKLRIRNSITASEINFSPFKSVQTGLWVQSAPCSMATGGGGLYSRG